MNATNTAIDDTTALSLFVTWLINMNVPDHALPDAIILQGVAALKAHWAANGYTPKNAWQEAIMYAAVAWTEVSEGDKLVWIARLIEVCKR